MPRRLNENRRIAAKDTIQSGLQHVRPPVSRNRAPPAQGVHRAAPIIALLTDFGTDDTVRITYADVAIGQPIALIGSSGLLEIALRSGSAAKALKLKNGDRLTLGN